MKGAILSTILSAGAVAAQLTIDSGLLNIAAVNPNDPQYSTCTIVGSYVGLCLTRAGGATADPTKLLSCACSASATPVYPLYSYCSSYLSAEGGTTYKDSYSAYSVLYSACGGSAGPTTAANTVKTAASSAASSAIASATRTAAGSASGTATITSAAQQTYATACNSMINIFASCTNKIKDFTNLGLKSQAACYCCGTTSGSAVWTDAMDKYASTCAAWAKTGEPLTAYPLASTLATFCSHFSDACSGGGSATAGSAATTTGAGVTGAGSNTDPVTITIPASTSTTTKAAGNDAASARVAGGAVVAAVAALALAL